MTKRFPKGWDEKRVAALIDHYEHLTEGEAVAEDEAAYEDEGQLLVRFLNDGPGLGDLIAEDRRARRLTGGSRRCRWSLGRAGLRPTQPHSLGVRQYESNRSTAHRGVSRA
ncbi:MAG: hypothetical protein U5R48_04280 [Gammaproteobacteria bacterium]|nr:hypothetical protein [Gammaproteobacteria bacterium]